MTTEDDFQAALDAHPDDWQTRLVFADWLEDRDDPRADGYRAMGMNRLYPAYNQVENYWVFQNAENRFQLASWVRHQVASDWFWLARDEKRDRDIDWFGYCRRRRAAEDSAALAFAKLPAARRRELLENSPSPT